jgi:hypothetical protein
VRLDPSIPVERVTFGRSRLAHHGRLFSPHRGPLALLAFPHTVDALKLARLSCTFTLIGDSFPTVGCLLAHVGLAVASIRDFVAIIGHSLPLDQTERVRIYLSLAHLDLDLARLELRLTILGNRVGLAAVLDPRPCRVRGLAADCLGPAPFQHRPGTLVGGDVPMQAGALGIARLLPECRGSVVLDRRVLMTSGRLFVGERRISHPPRV